MITVSQIKTKSQLEQAFEIRRVVFVVEQEVDPEEEYDEFEEESTHFLASMNETPVGTARYRKTENGYKLERFAVLESARGNGVGSALVSECLKALSDKPYLYLHAQEHAMPLYAKFDFQPIGDRFWECGIPHFKMIKTS